MNADGRRIVEARRAASRIVQVIQDCYMKPDSEIYNLACERLGISPTKTVFVGDGGFDELQGAAAVGMRPVQARWYYAREIEWNATSELSCIDEIGDLFHRLERMRTSRL